MKTYTKTEAVLLWSEKITEGVLPGFDDTQNKCCYRSPCGKECALGVLIPHDVMPEEYTFGVEHLQKEIKAGTKHIEADFDHLIEGLDVTNLASVQNLHDDTAKKSFLRESPSAYFRKTFFTKLRDNFDNLFADVPDEIWEKVLQEDNHPKE